MRTGIKYSVCGFTLAELLIALAILGVIATFTIPKVLQTQQSNRYKSVAKEAASMISGAYDAYKAGNTASASTGSDALTAYMNYVSVDTTNYFDYLPVTPMALQCDNATFGCLRLHNGGMLVWGRGEVFNDIQTTNGISFLVDPDGGTNNGSSTGPYASVGFILYYSGRFTTTGNALPHTESNQTTIPAPSSTWDPTWFSWD